MRRRKREKRKAHLVKRTYPTTKLQEIQNHNKPASQKNKTITKQNNKKQKKQNKKQTKNKKKTTKIQTAKTKQKNPGIFELVISFSLSTLKELL